MNGFANGIEACRRVGSEAYLDYYGALVSEKVLEIKN